MTKAHVADPLCVAVKGGLCLPHTTLTPEAYKKAGSQAPRQTV